MGTDWGNVLGKKAYKIVFIVIQCYSDSSKFEANWCNGNWLIGI